MKPEIVWRNPAPPQPSESKIEARESDASGSRFWVHHAGVVTLFEVILGRAA